MKKGGEKKLFLKIGAVLLLIIVLVFIGNVIYKWQVLSKIYDHNVNYEIGNNYKIIVTDEKTNNNTQSTYKDGIGIFKSTDDRYIWSKDNVMYLIFQDEKEYIKSSLNTTFMDSTIYIQSYGLIDVENKFDLFRKIFTEGIKINTENYENHSCYVITSKNEKLFIDKDTLFIIRDESKEKSRTIKIEIGTVTDEEVKLPNLEEYSEKKQ